MNANEIGQDVSADVEMEETLVEVGKVSETQGGILGWVPDVGNGLRGS